MKNPKVVQSLCSVDWLTMTIKRSHAQNMVSEMAHEYLTGSVETGSNPVPFEHYGYNGWSCNGMQWGRRETDDILRLTGDTAGLFWQTYLCYADNVSRVDLAVTLKFDHNHTDLVAKQFENLRLEALRGTHLITYSKTEGLQAGYTLYVGSRSSAQFGRLYDKEAQSGHAEHWLNCLRWEVEFKKPLAWEVAQELSQTAHLESTIYNRVYQWFTDRYVYVPNLGAITTTPLAIPRKQLPDEKRLEWLRKSVSPTVRKLIARGLEAEVRKALSIDIDDNTD